MSMRAGVPIREIAHSLLTKISARSPLPIASVPARAVVQSEGLIVRLWCHMRLERRAQFRVELGEDAGLQVTIPNPDGSPFSGQLVNVSADGAGAFFLTPDCPTLAVGQEVELVLASEDLTTPVTVVAMVRYRVEEEDVRSYGFQFIEIDQVEAQLSPGLRRIFNRRQALRVPPDPKYPVRVLLEGDAGGPRVEVRLADLSVTGAGLRLEPEAESTFAKTSTVRISLCLPDCGEPVNMTGNIRHRSLIDAEIHYGIEFDPELSEDFARQQKAIINYVTQRQREMLQRLAR